MANYFDFLLFWFFHYIYLDIILVKGLSKHTLNTYFSSMKIDPKYLFFHAFVLICPSCPFQNLLMWQKPTIFSNFARFCTPKRCTRVYCLVLKNNPNYMIFFNDIQLQIQVRIGILPTVGQMLTRTVGHRVFAIQSKHLDIRLLIKKLCTTF